VAEPFAGRVGVTATRNIVTGAQFHAMTIALVLLRQMGAVELHHGDCQNGDVDTARQARALGYHIVGHPGHGRGGRSDRAYSGGFVSDVTFPAKPYLVRDRDIVEAVEVLIGLSPTPREISRSGTWATIRMARARALPRVVIGPSGEVIETFGCEELCPIHELRFSDQLDRKEKA
jgi:hypothetical protein